MFEVLVILLVQGLVFIVKFLQPAVYDAGIMELLCHHVGHFGAVIDSLHHQEHILVTELFSPFLSFILFIQRVLDNACDDETDYT